MENRHGFPSLHAASVFLAQKHKVSPKAIRDIWKGRSWLGATFDLWESDDRPPRKALGRPRGKKDSRPRQSKNSVPKGCLSASEHYARHLAQSISPSFIVPEPLNIAGERHKPAQFNADSSFRRGSLAFSSDPMHGVLRSQFSSPNAPAHLQHPFENRFPHSLFPSGNFPFGPSPFPQFAWHSLQMQSMAFLLPALRIEAMARTIELQPLAPLKAQDWAPSAPSYERHGSNLQSEPLPSPSGSSRMTSDHLLGN
jgi:hypothetical protein